MNKMYVVIPKNYRHFAVSCLFEILSSPILTQCCQFQFEIVTSGNTLNHLPSHFGQLSFAQFYDQLAPAGHIIVISDFDYCSRCLDSEVANLANQIDKTNHLILAMGDSSKLFSHLVSNCPARLSVGVEVVSTPWYQRFADIRRNIPVNQNSFSCIDHVITTRQGFAYFQAVIFLLMQFCDPLLINQLSNSLQYSLPDFLLERAPYSTSQFAKTLVWLDSHYLQVRHIDELAKMACMSRRNFDRKFSDIYQQSPKQWLIKKKLAVAQQALIGSSESFDEIAVRSGFDSAAKLRKHFVHVYGVTPSEFRKQQN